MSVLLTCTIVCKQCREVKKKALETRFLSPDEGIMEKTFLEIFRRENWELTEAGNLCNNCSTLNK